MKPRVRRVDGLYHLRYRMPQVIHCSTIYPRRSPDGCEIILCGHERGLLVLWRGVHDTKQTGGNAEPRNDDDRDAMAIDEPDESDDELGETLPYASIRHHVNLPLQSAVRHIASLPLPQSSLQDALVQPELLRHNVVVAVACEDNSVRLLAFPLASLWTKSRQAAQENERLDEMVTDWPGIQVRTISRLPGPSNLPQGVSISLSSSSDQDHEGADDDDDAGEAWEILVAHHSRHLSGKIHIHRVPLSEGGDALHESSLPSLVQTVYLSSPAAAVQMMVSTTSEGSKVAKILVACVNSPLRVYECPLDTDTNGRWTLALSAGTDSTAGIEQRHKAVTDARWALGGNVVIVLVRAGEWLLFDASVQKSATFGSGAIPVRPALSGRVRPSGGDRTPTFATPGGAQPKLAPMTPGTRQSRQDTLFRGQSNTSITPTSFGGISVTLQKRASSTAQDLETVVIWSGDGAIVISDFAAFWRNRDNHAADPFRGGIGAHARPLPATNLDGEMRTGVSVFAPMAAPTSKFRARHADALIAGQLSFVIIAAPLPSAQEAPTSTSQRGSAPPDVALLTTGELDVAGLDRMLDYIEDNAASVQNGSQR